MTTAEQATVQLAGANRVRQERAALRYEIKSLRRPEAWALAADVLRNPPKFMWSMDVQTFLRWVPRIGDAQVEVLCELADVSPVARLGGAYGAARGGGPVATERQRGVLAARLVEGGW